MTNDEVINVLKKSASVDGNGCKNCPSSEMCKDTVCADTVLRLVLSGIVAKEKERAAARDPRWIAATEQLPKPFESVLLHIPEEAPLPTVHEGYIDNEGNWHRLSCFDAGSVTHWMPMPSAPEEG